MRIVNLDIRKKNIYSRIKFLLNDYTIGCMIIGIDEVGRGAWAGPMVICGVVYKDLYEFEIEKSDKKGTFWKLHKDKVKIGDSKQLSFKQRILASNWIKEHCKYEIVEIENMKIDELGLRKAWEWGVEEVLYRFMDFDLGVNDNYEVMVDGNWVLENDFFSSQLHSKNINTHMRAVVKGDQQVLEIASASIVAKVYRDELMKKFALDYPEYGWERNVGYGTKGHRDAIHKLGMTGLHRCSWSI